MTDNVIDLADKFRRILERNDAAALERLVRAYEGLWYSIKDAIDLLAAELERKGELTVAQLTRLDRFKRLMKQTETELEKYGNYMAVELPQASRAAIALGEEHARGLILAGLGGVNAEMQALNPAVLETLIGFLSPGGALMKKLDGYAPYHGKRIEQAIFEFIAKGKNPRTLAAALARDYGYALTDALRMSRTVQIYSYREANRASYLANDRVVEGWIWHSVLDPGRTCMSCVAKHGSFHTLDERLNDHHNGLCFMVPQTIFGLGAPIQSGEDWFGGLDNATQAKMMGAEKYKAWWAGKFEFSALSVEHDDDVYGRMWTEAPLKDLIKKAVETD